MASIVYVEETTHKRCFEKSYCMLACCFQKNNVLKTGSRRGSLDVVSAVWDGVFASVRSGLTSLPPGRPL